MFDWVVSAILKVLKMTNNVVDGGFPFRLGILKAFLALTSTHEDQNSVSK